MNIFETGKTYGIRFITDASMKACGKIINRTAKFATIVVNGEQVRCSIKSNDEGEFLFPFGKYSMAPVMRA